MAPRVARPVKDAVRIPPAFIPQGLFCVLRRERRLQLEQARAVVELAARKGWSRLLKVGVIYEHPGVSVLP